MQATKPSSRLLIYAAGAVMVMIYAYLVSEALYTGDYGSLYVLPVVFGIIAMLYRPYWGLLIVLMLSPLKTYGDEVLLIARLFGIGVVGITFLGRMQRHKSITWSGVEGPIALTAGAMALSFFRTTRYMDVVYTLLSFISLYGLVLLIVNLVEEKKHLREIAIYFMLSGIFPIVQALLEAGQGPNPERTFTRVSGTFTIATGLGGFLIPIVTMALALFIYPHFSRQLKLLFMGILGGGMLALMYTLSRGAIFGVACGFGVILFFLMPKGRGGALNIVVVGVLTIAAIWSYWPSIEGRVLAPIAAYFSGNVTMTTITQRTDELSLVLPIALDTYFLGTGIGNYTANVPRYRIMFDVPDLPGVPHNIFLYFFGVVGIIGVVGFFWLIFWIAHHGLTSYSFMKHIPDDLTYTIFIGAIASLIGFVPFIITHNGLFSNEMWISLGFLIASVKIGRETYKQRTQQPEELPA